MADQRKVALDKALKNIEKEFGKGSIMRMGDKADTQISTIPSGSLALDDALGVGDTHGAESLKFMDLKVQVRPPWRFMRLPKFKSAAARLPTLMPKTPWIRFMQPTWA